MSGTFVRIGLGLSLSAFVTAGFLSATAGAKPPNACTYTNSNTGGSATYCGPCSNETAGVTTKAVYVEKCSSSAAPTLKEKEVPKQQERLPDDGGAQGGGEDATPKPKK